MDEERELARLRQEEKTLRAELERVRERRKQQDRVIEVLGAAVEALQDGTSVPPAAPSPRPARRRWRRQR